MEQVKLVKIDFKCRQCGKTVPIVVRENDLKELQSDSPRMIHEIFPYLSAGEREMFMSRFCEECFDGMFKDDEE